LEKNSFKKRKFFNDLKLRRKRKFSCHPASIRATTPLSDSQELLLHNCTLLKVKKVGPERTCMAVFVGTSATWDHRFTVLPPATQHK